MFLMDCIEEQNIDNKIKKATDYIKLAKKIVVISGAGLDTKSGLPDFRGSKGIYSKNPESILDINNFWLNPGEVIEFLEKYLYFPEAKPNKAHKLLGALEEGREVTHITQNITALLEDGGAKNVLHMHGDISTGSCLLCGKQYDIKENLKCYKCDCNEEALIKPNIVFYGEAIMHEFEAIEKIKECDLMIILGTSMTVYPVAELPIYLKTNVPLIIINHTSTPYDNGINTLVFRNDISDILEKIIK